MDYGGLMPALPPLTDESVASLEMELDSFLKPLLAESKGLRWQAKVIEQINIREGIRKHVAESDTDLVVLGTLGKTNLRMLLMGSTAERIVTHAHCSVLAVKPEGFVDPVEERFSRSAGTMVAAGPAHEAEEHACSCRTKDACIRSMPAAIGGHSKNEKEAAAPGR
jgi:hypothetical protein